MKNKTTRVSRAAFKAAVEARYDASCEDAFFACEAAHVAAEAAYSAACDEAYEAYKFYSALAAGETP
jgi:peptidyl-tRNA hydrolase